ncbi:MAG: DegT/DnrJ/EryC1/StrS family aminotransferase [Xanthobacteraceae bacterium]
MRIPLNKSTVGEEERNAAKAVIDSDALTMGAQCRAFEREFAGYLGVEHAVMVNSGSSANLIALFALADARSFPPTARCRTVSCRGRRSLFRP